MFSFESEKNIFPMNKRTMNYFNDEHEDMIIPYTQWIHIYSKNRKKDILSKSEERIKRK